ncbi:dynamin family protein [Halenospora varia]|nr:dynamin family protein [Halenospora varia]
MLDKIDKLFACNVGDYINLPQIVVVGDQSSRKSSVLEGLTDLPFPRDSGLCTRFATQITFRRSVTRQIAVLIVPARDSSADHAKLLRSWAKDMEILDQKAFAEIIREVHTVIGISNDPVQSKPFSNDVLCLEVCGPEQEHLSVIDVLGIFKRTTQGVTSKADMQMVKSMVQGYIENPRSVILAVILANVDIATQEILEMAEEVDLEGQRTLGVLTKPDLVDKGAEKAVVDLIEGRRHQLALGWHLVRNPGQQELSDPTTDRHALERTFFALPPYNNLDKDKVGIPALKIRLQEVLATHTRCEFPKVKSELNKKLKTCRSSLANLGEKRETLADQSKYLIDVATRFQEVASLALDAKYWGNDIFNQHSNLKLATLIVNRSEAFSKMVEEMGHTYQFEAAIKGLPEPLLTEVYRASRGFKLGTFDPSLLTIIIKEQLKKWDSIALGYINSLLERYKKAVAQVAFILQVKRRQKRMQQVMLEKSFNDCSHDVVCMQAAKHHLISGPTTPLKLFSPAFVGIMTLEQLEEVVGEDPRQKRTRKQLLKEMEDLEKGKKILI